eukprot:2919505-Pleurochrysis_carterae.AAC.5
MPLTSAGGRRSRRGSSPRSGRRRRWRRCSGPATAEERRQERWRRDGAALPTLSMPAAELFGTWAVAEAVSVAQGHRPQAVVAVGDCDPAAAAINAASSGRAQMREDANADADRLSYPHLLPKVVADAEAAGLCTRRARCTPACWTALAAAMDAGGIEMEERDGTAA